MNREAAQSLLNFETCDFQNAAGKLHWLKRWWMVCS